MYLVSYKYHSIFSSDIVVIVRDHLRAGWLPSWRKTGYGLEEKTRSFPTCEKYLGGKCLWRSQSRLNGRKDEEDEHQYGSHPWRVDKLNSASRRISQQDFQEPCQRRIWKMVVPWNITTDQQGEIKKALPFQVALEKISEVTLIKSFKTCCIMNALGGTENYVLWVDVENNENTLSSDDYSSDDNDSCSDDE